LKTNSLRYILSCIFLLLVVACSTKKNSFVGRNWHALNSKYNTLYNGDVALEKGVIDLKKSYKDNFWEILPVERMIVPEEAPLPGERQKNQDFERAETKATKAIQKHSMNINGREKNMQMDEAHLLLGKTRYYDLRFIPALEAFNYVLYKYPNSNNIYEVKVWREKTNIRLENESLAIKNLKKLIKEKDLSMKVLADANAILSQAYLNLEQKDSAIAPLKKALASTNLKEEKARYHYILGQLYESLSFKDSAYVEFQNVINMKRKSPRQYVIQAHAKQAQLVDPTQDTIAFLKKYAKLLKDRENRPHLDVLNFQMGSFYDNLNKKSQAITFYNKSLRARSEDAYLQATTYKKLATIYFDKTKYVTAGQYYDSTLTKLVKKNREYFSIVKKRENLVDVIKYEGIVKNNDSILRLVSLSETDRKSFFEDYIAKIKAEEEAKKAKEAKEKEVQSRLNNPGITDVTTSDFGKGRNRNDLQQPPISDDVSFKKSKTSAVNNSNDLSKSSSFYFYNATTVAYGKIQFEKRWKRRALKENWRFSSQENTTDLVNDDKVIDTTNSSAMISEKYTTDFYLKQLPTSQIVIDSLAKERNFANYQLGVIYKEKFKEYPLSASKFETLLQNKPEERFVLPSLYNLFKIYELTDKSKAEAVKNQIITNYPNTRYAQILSGKIVEEDAIAQSPEETYKNVYKQFENQEFLNVLETTQKSLDQFAGDDLIPKFELIKASAIGKLQGVEAYKKAINYVAVTYPNTKEGLQAEDILNVSIPRLEQMALVKDSLSKSWKVLYKAGKREDATTKELVEKIKKYIIEKQYDKYSVSYDVYNETENFIVVHGISSKEYAEFFIELLRVTKNYRIETPAKVISSDNYSVVQVKKNYKEFLELK
jgi:hypothetical protein